MLTLQQLRDWVAIAIPRNSGYTATVVNFQQDANDVIVAMTGTINIPAVAASGNQQAIAAQTIDTSWGPNGGSLIGKRDYDLVKVTAVTDVPADDTESGS